MFLRVFFSSSIGYCHDNDILVQDCFFVSVVIRKHPDLLDKPVAVCHSDNPRGTAEISSANYPARGHGEFYADLFYAC